MHLIAEFIEFLARTLFWFWRDYRTRNWPTVRGEVQSSRLSGTSVQVIYTYKVDNERFAGWHDKSFGTRAAAEDYAKLFIPKWSIVVRYSGADPTNSLVLEDDQSTPPAWATRYSDAER